MNRDNILTRTIRAYSAFCNLPFAFCLLLFAFCLLPFTFCNLPFAFCLLLFAFCLLPFAFCNLPFAFCLLLFASCLSPNTLFSQDAKGGIPLSISAKISTPEAFNVPTPDWAHIREEDKGAIGSFRFAVPIAVDLTMQNAGTWRDLPDGNRLWQCPIRSADALGLALTLENFELPKGAKLYLLAPDGSSVLGAYDSDNNTESRKIFIGFVRGQEAVLEYFEPKKSIKKADFAIKTVYHAYNQTMMGGVGFGASVSCHINANCPAAANWQPQKRGVVRIRVVTTQGVGWCSGALVNNTQRDGKPYILSAYHCSDGMTPDYSQWTFYFNYESPTCQNPQSEPISRSIQGCMNRAGARETDFLLLELNFRIALDVNAQYLGWNRDSTTLPSSTIMMHHPQGDIKKYSRDSHAPIVFNTSSTWSNGSVSPPKTHLHAVFDEGLVEPGSSGAPLFNQSGLIVGQLHGGGFIDSCHISYASCGWFAKSWDGNGTPSTRLKDWLDPLSTGVKTLDSTSTPTTTIVSGLIKTWWNEPMANQKVFIGSDSAMTNASGTFTFNYVPLNTPLSVKITRSTNMSNGIDVVDLLLIRRGILGITNLRNEQQFAGDVDGSEDLDVVDILHLRRYLLGITQTLPSNVSWHFYPESTIQNINSPFDLFSVSFTAVTFNFNFIGVKLGDLDGSADSSD
jgi:lysyl endopeptidase